jgi:hypothetical protein
MKQYINIYKEEQETYITNIREIAIEHLADYISGKKQSEIDYTVTLIVTTEGSKVTVEQDNLLDEAFQWLYEQAAEQASWKQAEKDERAAYYRNQI